VRWPLVGRQHSWWVSALVAVLVAVTGAVPSTPSGTASAHPLPNRTLRVTALGDSVVKGTGCGCTPFPERYAALAGQRWHRPVHVDNFGTNGLDTAGLVSQLSDANTERSVESSDVVVVTIGANDFEAVRDQVTAGSCAPASGARDCAEDTMRVMQQRLGAVLARVRQLRGHHPGTVLVTGYWNVFQDGEVARRAYPAPGVQASLRLTRDTNHAIRAVVSAAGATYVDLYQPFQEAPGGITPLLASDGDHPSGQGDDVIAATLLRNGPPKVSDHA
jgi:lysophospholipase L1-like esterase